MERTVTAAAIQFNITLGEIDRNLAKAEAALRRVAAKGAQLAVLPEMWSAGFAYKKLTELAAETPRVLERIAALSLELNLTVVGSLPELAGDRVCNTAYVTDRGDLAGSYRKLHLFSLMNENEHIAAGEQSAVVDTSVGKLGLAVCYDLRFPELYRALQADVLLVPSAFTYTTGQAHWEVLLRARAIENLAYVVAAAQGGTHENARRTWGHSMVVDPWGEIVAQQPQGPGVVMAQVTAGQLEMLRGRLPALRHRVL